MPCQRQGIKCGMFVFTFEWLLYKGSCAKILGPVVHVVAPAPSVFNSKKMKMAIFCPPLWYRSWTKAQAERRQQNVSCVAGPKPVSAGHDQQYSEWHRRPVWDVQHHHEAQTQGEQFQGLHSTWDIRSALIVHCICVLSSDLELWSSQHNPSLMYCTYYTLLGIEAVRLGPGQL